MRRYVSYQTHYSRGREPIGPRRTGRAIKLRALLELAGVSEKAAFITLHAAADDFSCEHSAGRSPRSSRGDLSARRCTIDQQSWWSISLSHSDHAACKTAEIDECANVKFIDTIELSIERGHDNTTSEERAHAELHRRQAEQQQQ